MIPTELSPVGLFAAHSFVTLCALGFFMTLLGTLVARLHVTFKGSFLQISKYNLYFFVMIFALMFILIIVYLIIIALYLFGNMKSLDRFIEETKLTNLFLYFGIIFIGIFLIGSGEAIRLFVVNVIELTKLQCGTFPSCDMAEDSKVLPLESTNLSFNSRQGKLLNLSAKYVSLFSMASLSTILFFILGHFINEIDYFIFPFDLSANLFYLSLQFAFADELYHKLCCCWDSCCTAMVHSKASKSILKEYTARNSKLMHIPLDADEETQSDDDDPNSDPLIDESASEKCAEM